MTDSFGREIDYMRVSITDRCNLRCKYCMPEDLKLVSRDDILRREEIARICRIASECGIKHIKITGGEPFARKGSMDIIRDIKSLPKIEDVSVTTNGMLLGEHLTELEAIDVKNINISLDTLNEKAYQKMTGSGEFSKVCYSMFRAFQSDFKIKVNCVPMRGFNDDQLVPLAKLATRNDADVRFIELMPLGHGRDFERIPGDEVLEVLTRAFPSLREVGDETEKRGFGPAKYYTADGFKGALGLIDAVSHGFCGGCNRVRLTSEGFLKTCLYFGAGVDFRPLIRGGASDDELIEAFKKAVGEKPAQHLFNTDDAGKEHEMSKIGG